MLKVCASDSDYVDGFSNTLCSKTTIYRTPSLFFCHLLYVPDLIWWTSQQFLEDACSGMFLLPGVGSTSRPCERVRKQSHETFQIMPQGAKSAAADHHGFI